MVGEAGLEKCLAELRLAAALGEGPLGETAGINGQDLVTDSVGSAILTRSKRLT